MWPFDGKTFRKHCVYVKRDKRYSYTNAYGEQYYAPCDLVIGEYHRIPRKYLCLLNGNKIYARRGFNFGMNVPIEEVLDAYLKYDAEHKDDK